MNFYCTVVPGYAAIVALITDLLRGKSKDIMWGNAQETAFLMITICLTLGKTPILGHYDPYRPVLVETDASDLAIAGILSQQFEDLKLHPVSCIFVRGSLLAV